MKILKKKLYMSATIWNVNGNPLTDYVINYSLFGIIIHSVTIKEISLRTAEKMFPELREK